MTTQELVSEGLLMMLIGMGTVFSFLALLVVAILLMSWLIARLPQEPVATVPAMTAPQAHSEEADPLLAVITAAVMDHRKRKTRSRQI